MLRIICIKKCNNLENKILLGSVARKYLRFLLTSHVGTDPILHLSGTRQKSANPSELFGTFRRNSQMNLNSVMLNERQLCGNTLLSISPLHEDFNGIFIIIKFLNVY